MISGWWGRTEALTQFQRKGRQTVLVLTAWHSLAMQGRPAQLGEQLPVGPAKQAVASVVPAGHTAQSKPESSC